MKQQRQSTDCGDRARVETGKAPGGWLVCGGVYGTGILCRRQRALAGSIYYLLGGADISAFHEIDCDELWYYHEGTGMRLYVLKKDGRLVQHLLGRLFSVK